MKTEDEIQERMHASLARQHRPNLKRIRVDVEPDCVRLEGAVSSFYEKQLAFQVSRQECGNRQIVDRVLVAPISG
ncbi:MAG: BON domain-containing protein [Pirellulaceae bacterium]|jgi:osmotically-inducible protein OsmY|nr:BON domain-containing protein [Pirellulaceae bacterium]MDP7018954.1 BON domain-containing protein [Pirellulaceae bacterium]